MEREVIVSVFTGTWHALLLQLYASLRRLGMEHLLALTAPDEAACTALLEVEPGERGSEGGAQGKERLHRRRRVAWVRWSVKARGGHYRSSAFAFPPAGTWSTLRPDPNPARALPMSVV